MKKLPLCCYLMPWENWGFYWSSDLTLIPDWKSKIVNQSGLQTNLWKIDVIPQKGELFRKKASLNDFFSSELQFLFVTWPHVTTWTKGHVSSSLVTIGLVKVEIWKYNVLHSWLCWRWSLTLTHQPAKYGSHRSCASRGIIQVW